MCLRDTGLRFQVMIARNCVMAAWLAAACAASGQTSASPLSTSQFDTAWKRVAGMTINEGLAGAASGPVSAIWYSAGASGLLAQTQSGRIFETSDFVHWRLNTTAIAPSQANSTAASPPVSPPVLLPETTARIQAVSGRLYAAGVSNLYASEDNGQTWLNLTGFNNRSVIGDGFASLTVSPANPQEISAANQFGVWRSLDGGLSWQSLNEDLPNLMVRKLVARRTVALADGTLAELNAGSWTPAAGSDPELALRQRFGAALHLNVSAAAQAGTVGYAGTADGRVLVSRDNGATWDNSSGPGGTTGTGTTGTGITRIWVDSERPDVALAASGSRLFRTVNGGLFWDEVTGALPPGQIHGIAADRSAGVVYLATDSGVYARSVSLNDAGNDAGGAAGNWTSIARDLPVAPAWDVVLNADGTLTVALDGYGVFESPAPYRTHTVRLVSGADLTDRAAAPGSLVSVLGARVETVSNQGVAYPVLASSDQSSQLQVPFEAVAGTFSLALESTSGRWTVPLTVKNAAPAIFVDADGSPLILDAASGLVLDPKVAVYAGSTVEVLATGLGKVTPDWPTGVPAPLDMPPAVTGTVTAFLDGRPIEVTRAVLAPGYVGYYLVELQFPAIVNRGASEFRIVMNGEESNRVKLYLEPNSPGSLVMNSTIAR
ncbi:MAG: hypothetical protein ABSG41_04870 [Bryobacteraceae bacterium]|jgi:uncharacterized protein (TIGR03437 family)